MQDDKNIMYSSDEVEHTLDDHFMTDALRGARSKELEILREQISALYTSFKRPLKIFDIGVGDGHVPINLGKRLLGKIEKYIGIDNSAREVLRCEKNIKEAKLEEIISVIEFDATRLEDDSFRQKLPLPFHAVLCTYFTPGNFRPNEIKLEEAKPGQIVKYPQSVLKPNRKFQKVFSDAYDMLPRDGKLIIGSTYIDSDATRLKQEEFYKKCGMHVITTAEDEFTATREGFWSERFTREKILNYLNWIPRENIAFLPLDTDNFARMIVITK